MDKLVYYQQIQQFDPTLSTLTPEQKLEYI